MKKKQQLFKIPMPVKPDKCKDFVDQIDWRHFWRWKGAPRKAA